MLREFKDFAMHGNVMDMAVGIIIGAAFGPIVGSLVGDIIMPPIGLVLGNVDFSNLFATLKHGAVEGPYASVAAAKAAGAVTINYGLFINTIINFIIVAFAIFIMIKAINKMKREQPAPTAAPTTKDCPACCMTVPINATKCGHCTSAIA